MNLSELARSVFQTQLDRMQRNLEGSLAGVDPIHLHDLRVANRRTRAALIEFRDLLPTAVYQTYREHFRWIHRVTGPVRDLDIGISCYPVYEKKISKGWRDKLIPARKLLEEKRQAAQDELAGHLGSDKFEKILLSWAALLDEGVLEGSQMALESAREFGCRQIIKRYNKVRAQGSKIGKKTPAEQYHNLRIDVKKLRYLIDFFRPVFDREEISRLLSGLKGFQDALGGYQDAEVQIQSLSHLGQALHESGTPVEPVLALGQLIGIYEKELRRSRKRSLTAINWLVADATAREFQSCFKYPVE